jgi:hypothetical protein
VCIYVSVRVFLFRDFDVLRFSFWSFSFSDERGQGRVGGIQEGVFLCEVGGVRSLLWLLTTTLTVEP